MFGNLGAMAAAMKQAKELQGNIKRIKEEMTSSEFEASAGGDKVTAVVTGDFRVLRIAVRPGTPEAEIGELAAMAVNAAIDNAKCSMQEKIREASGGLDIPDIF